MSSFINTHDLKYYFQDVVVDISNFATLCTCAIKTFYNHSIIKKWTHVLNDLDVLIDMT